MNNWLSDSYRFAIFISNEIVGNNIDIVIEFIFVLKTVVDTIISQSACGKNKERNIVVMKRIKKICASRSEICVFRLHSIFDDFSRQTIAEHQRKLFIPSFRHCFFLFF